MQIKASQRRVTTRVTPPHTVLARRWALQRRLVTGGVAGLTVSVLAWLFGASLQLHLGLVAVGFALGFFWRFTLVSRRAESWAFSWIEARAGLSYLTAHELAAAESGAESGAEPAAVPKPASPTSGFSEAVRARAARVGRLETPALQPWALPLIVLALALAIVPNIVLPTLRTPFAPLSEQAPGTGPEPSVFETPVPLTTPDPETPAPASPEQAATPDTGTAPEAGTTTPAEDALADDSGTDDPGLGRSFNDAGPAPEGGSAEGERAALDRFLEQNSETNAPRVGSDAGGTGTRNEPRSGSNTPNEAQAGQDAQNATANDEGRGNEGESGAGSPAGQETAQNPNSGQEGGSGESAQTEAPGDEGSDTGQAGAEQNAPQAEPGTDEQRAQSSLEQTGRQDDPAARAGSSAGERSAAPNDGADMPDDPQGSSSERAGTSAGSDIESSRERLEGTLPNAAEQLTGAREDGPISFAGEALRQGDAPDTLPQTGDAASYRRAAEEVIREGRIPLEYQDVIRNYFR